MLIRIFEFLLFSFEKSPCSGWNSPRFSFLLHPRWPFQLCYSTLNFLPPSGWVHRLVRLRSLHYWGIIHSIFFCWSFRPFQLRWLLKHECYISLLAYINITPLLFLMHTYAFGVWVLSAFVANQEQSQPGPLLMMHLKHFFYLLRL